jgi:hypothetical protein
MSAVFVNANKIINLTAIKKRGTMALLNCPVALIRWDIYFTFF